MDDPHFTVYKSNKKKLLHFNALSVTITKFYFPRTFLLLEIPLEQADRLNHRHSVEAAKRQRRVSDVDSRLLGYTVPPHLFCYGFVGLLVFWCAVEPADSSERGLKAVLVLLVHVLISSHSLSGPCPPGMLLCCPDPGAQAGSSQ